MKFRRTPKFRRDFDSLDIESKRLVREARPTIEAGLQGSPEWYQHHKIKRMKGHHGIWEGHIKQNLVFTMHYEDGEDGEKICYFRRVGTHKIYDNP